MGTEPEDELTTPSTMVDPTSIYSSFMRHSFADGAAGDYSESTHKELATREATETRRSFGIRPRPRLHGHVRLLCRPRRRRVDRDHSSCNRPRGDLSRYSRHLWSGHQRDIGRHC